jgi:hypothetical protein
MFSRVSDYAWFGCISQLGYPFRPVSASYWRFLGTGMGSNLCLKFPGGVSCLKTSQHNIPDLWKIFGKTAVCVCGLIFRNMHHFEEIVFNSRRSMNSWRVWVLADFKIESVAMYLVMVVLRYSGGRFETRMSNDPLSETPQRPHLQARNPRATY